MSDTQASQALLSPFIHALDRLEDSFKRKWMQLHAHKLQIHARLREEFESQFEHAIQGEDIDLITAKLKSNLERIVRAIDAPNATKSGIDLLLQAATSVDNPEQVNGGTARNGGTERNGNTHHNNSNSSTTNHTRTARESASGRTPTLPTTTNNKRTNSNTNRATNHNNTNPLIPLHHEPPTKLPPVSSWINTNNQRLLQSLMNAPATAARAPPTPTPKPKPSAAKASATAARARPASAPKPIISRLSSASVQPKHACPHCDRMFYSVNGRSTHIGMVHKKRQKARDGRRTSPRRAAVRSPAPSSPLSKSRSRSRGRPKKRHSISISSDNDNGKDSNNDSGSESDNDSDIAESDPSIVALEKKNGKKNTHKQMAKAKENEQQKKKDKSPVRKQRQKKTKKENKVEVIVIESDPDDDSVAMDVDQQEQDQEHQNAEEHQNEEESQSNDGSDDSDKEDTPDSDEATQSDKESDKESEPDLEALSKQVDEMDADKVHCPICKKKFPKGQKSRAKNHLVVHSDSRPHACKCGKTFKRLESVAYHLRQGNCKKPKKK